MNTIPFDVHTFDCAVWELTQRVHCRYFWRISGRLSASSYPLGSPRGGHAVLLRPGRRRFFAPGKSKQDAVVVAQMVHGRTRLAARLDSIGDRPHGLEIA